MRALSLAVTLLPHMVSDDGEAEAVSVEEATVALGMVEFQARAAIGTLERTGFVVSDADTVRPTTAGIALGVEIAHARRRVEQRALPTGRRFWTYLPEEVDLSG